MDGDALLQKALELIKKIPRSAYLPLALALIGCVFLCIGLIELLKPITANPNLPIETSIHSQSLPPSILVDVEGAVENPGVYHIISTGRLQEALIAAGGLSGNADRQYVAKNLNLAAKLVDGGKVYIPTTTDVVQNKESSIKNLAGDGVLGEQTSLMDINSASAQELDSLPGVGLVTAQKIISGRPYSSVEDLLTKKIVNQKVYGEIKDKVAVN